MEMLINANTKIAAILKQDARTLDVLVCISPAFRKLRNPVLRKLMAGRTSITTAARLGGCTVEDFFKRLEPLGFKVDGQAQLEGAKQQAVPAFVTTLTKEKLVEIDVRPVLEAGSDPLAMILGKLKTLQPGWVLKLTNSFEPTPLLSLLQKKGFRTYVNHVNENLVETYVCKLETSGNVLADVESPVVGDWENIQKAFDGKLEAIDVRHLEMPQPMLTILAALDQLRNGMALVVKHKRVPVFLLPELAQRGFAYRIKEVSPEEISLLIYKEQNDNN